jgi:nucleotide-binding universal stress UspA family protein
MLAIDEDDISQEALHEAIYFAKSLKAKLRIIHVVDEGVLAGLERVPAISDEIKTLENSSEKFLHSVFRIAHDAGIEPETQLLKITERNQRIAFEIVDAAKEWSADLLVIGAYSRPGIHKLLLGHVAESILRIATIPVLILHMKKKL